ncbi:MAG: hypothetical protein H0T89_16495 [Deltaproteobacteria bacterium]|nr:hypothetical protein [Deltaproteobacteria bacterium]MDQ3299436.1 hypothetical protein [Myxococcota bacterium]
MMRVAIISLAITMGIVSGCSSSRSSTPSQVARTSRGSIAVDTDRFPHGVHTGNQPEIRGWQGRGLGCVDCHDARAVKEGRVARPGTNQHAPCDDCHKAEFGKPPGKLCKVCHEVVDPFTKGSSPLQSYPMRGTTQALASVFSHRLHLDKAEMERATGAHIGCADCHERDDKSRDPMVPGHKACARCHEGVDNVKSTLAMETCSGCHPPRNVELARGRRFITGDLKFAHATHETDKNGAPVKCTTCHANVDVAANREDMSVPPMVQCAQCHEDSSRSPDSVRMSNCGICHTQIASGSPPGNHMVGGSVGTLASAARPIDHTMQFRKHHGEQAAAKDSNCRFCHTEVQGAREDSCFQCHLVMKPRDHNLMWRSDHGREAQADGKRCASCHTPETCVACHSVPPRSHTPIADFRLGGHAEQARFGLSSCLTCHTYEDTCSKCHRGTR